jgi:hypothetical protein
MKTINVIVNILRRDVLLVCLIIFALVSCVLIFQVTNFINDDHFVRFAEALLRKDINLPPDNLPAGDYVLYQGMVYVYFGPLPSLLILPFVAFFGRAFPQVLIGISSLIAVFFGIYALSQRLRFSKNDSLWLAVFFVFSTVLLAVGIINITAYQIQALSTVFLVLALYEQSGRKRYWLTGIYIGFAGLTRFVLFGAVLFFLIELFREKKDIKRKLLLLLIPVIITAGLNAAYNHRRFHSVFETGYQYNVTLGTSPMRDQAEFGFLSLNHLPANLYVLLLKAPDPILYNPGFFVLKPPYIKADPWGMAIWFTSPLFLFLLTRFKKGPHTISAGITTVILMLPSLLYFGIGFSQFGYRYALDFLPFLFLLLLPSFNGKLSRTAKILIILGVLVNCLLITSLWGRYPHFGM